MILNTVINKLSYGYVGWNILKSLSKITDVSLFPIGNITIDHTEDNVNIVNRALKNAQLWDYSKPSIRIMHQHKLAEHPVSKLRVGFPIFELDDFNEVEKHNLRSQDHLFATSEWAKSVLSKVVPEENISVIPLGVDINIFRPEDSPVRNEVVFFNIGKWEYRKGHDILVEAFHEVFKDISDVRLWMMPQNKFITKEQEFQWLNLYRKKLGNKVVFIKDVQDHKDVAKLILQSDVGVFPYRSEGFCMPLTEFLACGKRVVATNYSAPTEYLTKDCAVMIDPDGLETAQDGVFFNGCGRWARLDKAYYRAFCDVLWAEYEIAKNSRRFNTSGVKQMHKFTWDNSANKIMESLELWNT